ncbi:hypothetical protein [Hyalangium sp.]|uniref:hypothetical protein n=1 Tax=Hyalangium sp. TaxID=2028555 RepID=UPI002D4B38B2|nr:hypothetical protein [Hyalangium sp.]HYI01868.1 hypothetical protein [Hyalangium sp.]
MGLVSTVLIVLAPTGCSKEPGPRSEAYEQAQKRFSTLYAQQLDGAFADPQMDEIEALLEQVPPDSTDAPSARELQQRIKTGRAKVEKARKEQEDAIASAREVDSVGPSAPTPSEPDPEPTPAPTEPRDAGPGTGGPEVGTQASELTAGYLGCFQRMKQITVTGRGLRDAWEMADRARCNQSYPGFVAKVVIIEDGKVFAVLPKSSVQTTFVTKDGGSTTGGPDSGP